MTKVIDIILSQMVWCGGVAWTRKELYCMLKKEGHEARLADLYAFGTPSIPQSEIDQIDWNINSILKEALRNG